MNLPTHLLDDWKKEAIRAASDAARETGSRVYLVGGPVRDMLAGICLGDLDLAVELNAEAFASTLSRSLGANLTSNERFLTWKLTVDSARYIDLAMPRTETYSQPGALPTVTPASSIEEDLQRRDFTVNAMAFQLAENRLVDPHDGRIDLDAGILKVLHDGSFVDDPTRIFRALRLASRLHLDMDPKTAALLDDAVRSGAIATVSRDRIWKEIEIACREPLPVPVFRSFAARDCLESPLDVKAFSRFGLPDDLSIPKAIDSRVVLLGALMRNSGGGAFRMLPLDQTTASRIREIATRRPSLAEDLDGARSVDELFTACDRASPEERFLAAAERPNAAAVVARFDRAASESMDIRGDQLGVPSGPWVGRALRETRRALFARSVEKHGALAFAQRKALEYLND